MGTVDQEVAAGERFEFGKNWTSFLREIDDARIQQAMLSIQNLFIGKSFFGKKFLDVGSGSGLMSLAARKLGMDVVSFDFDPASVACTNKLRMEHFRDDPAWLIYEGSVLDESFMSGLGSFDFVYSWGVLHHTGEMWGALDKLLGVVSANGYVVVAIYNDQGVWSKVWKFIKVTYNRLPRFLKTGFVVFVMAPRELKIMAVPLLKGRFRSVLQCWQNYGRDCRRGFTRWHDMVDWVGGYPFEVSKPENVFYFFKKRGFLLIELKTCAGELGCNEYVFQKQ